MKEGTMSTLHFFAPDWTREDEIKERRDQRVTVLDFDEVTQSHKVEFADGYRLVVYTSELLSRESA
jgi:hypothetical protein